MIIKLISLLISGLFNDTVSILRLLIIS